MKSCRKKLYNFIYFWMYVYVFFFCFFLFFGDVNIFKFSFYYILYNLSLLMAILEKNSKFLERPLHIPLLLRFQFFLGLYLNIIFKIYYHNAMNNKMQILIMKILRPFLKESKPLDQLETSHKVKIDVSNYQLIERAIYIKQIVQFFF